MPRRQAKAGKRKTISLALQGGGAHGAFTWGVLDAILEDGRLDIEAITGTSSGAMNAVAFAAGFEDGGREGARRSLERFWTSISSEGAFATAHRKVVDLFFRDADLQRNIAFWWADFLTHYASPYEFNPLNVNPLRDHLLSVVDFDKVRAMTQPKLFVSATNVETGRIAVFPGERLTADHVMASACLPFLFQAVEIDGAPYWDGGYMGNPALFPLFYETGCGDILIVQINPIERRGAPRTAREIQDRLNEITFNGALMGEFRSMDFVNRLIESGKLSGEGYMQTRTHRIDGGDELAAFAAVTKLGASRDVLQKLRDYGQTAARRWLDANFDKVGVEGTLDLRLAYHQ